MHRALVVLLAPLALAACAAEPPRSTPRRHRAARAPAPRPPGRRAPTSLTRPARHVRAHPRPRADDVRRTRRSRSRSWSPAASTADLRRTDVVRTATVGCPPPDAELWYFPTLDPNGADLDASPGARPPRRRRLPPGRRRPAPTHRDRVPHRRRRPRLRRPGPHVAAARRFARIAGLPFDARPQTRGLAAWTATRARRTTAITVELPPGRASARRATRLRVRDRPPRRDPLRGRAPTRSASGMIAIGRDPRATIWH